jgi:hypothetical protein
MDPGQGARRQRLAPHAMKSAGQSGDLMGKPMGMMGNRPTERTPTSERTSWSGACDLERTTGVRTSIVPKSLADELRALIHEVIETTGPDGLLLPSASGGSSVAPTSSRSGSAPLLRLAGR